MSRTRRNLPEWTRWGLSEWVKPHTMHNLSLSGVRIDKGPCRPDNKPSGWAEIDRPAQKRLGKRIFYRALRARGRRECADGLAEAE